LHYMLMNFNVVLVPAGSKQLLLLLILRD